MVGVRATGRAASARTRPRGTRRSRNVQGTSHVTRRASSHPPPRYADVWLPSSARFSPRAAASRRPTRSSPPSVARFLRSCLFLRWLPVQVPLSHHRTSLPPCQSFRSSCSSSWASHHCYSRACYSLLPLSPSTPRSCPPPHPRYLRNHHPRPSLAQQARAQAVDGRGYWRGRPQHR